jgi:hypothetical protein
MYTGLHSPPSKPSHAILTVLTGEILPARRACSAQEHTNTIKCKKHKHKNSDGLG